MTTCEDIQQKLCKDNCYVNLTCTPLVYFQLFPIQFEPTSLFEPIRLVPQNENRFYIFAYSVYAIDSVHKTFLDNKENLINPNTRKQVLLHFLLHRRVFIYIPKYLNKNLSPYKK